MIMPGQFSGREATDVVVHVAKPFCRYHRVRNSAWMAVLVCHVLELHARHRLT
jgi:hypothetical protein